MISCNMVGSMVLNEILYDAMISVATSARRCCSKLLFVKIHLYTNTAESLKRLFIGVRTRCDTTLTGCQQNIEAIDW